MWCLHNCLMFSKDKMKRDSSPDFKSFRIFRHHQIFLWSNMRQLFWVAQIFNTNIVMNPHKTEVTVLKVANYLQWPMSNNFACSQQSVMMLFKIGIFLWPYYVIINSAKQFFLLQLQYVGCIYSVNQNVRIAEYHTLQMDPPT